MLKDTLTALILFTGLCLSSGPTVTGPLEHAPVVEQQQEMVQGDGRQFGWEPLPDDTALVKAVRLGDTAAVEQALKEDRALLNKRDKFGATPIFYAREYGIAKILLKNKAKVDLTDSEGRGVMHYVIERLNTDSGPYSSAKHESLLTLLVRSGVPVKLKDRFGKTPSDYTVEFWTKGFLAGAAALAKQ